MLMSFIRGDFVERINQSLTPYSEYLTLPVFLCEINLKLLLIKKLAIGDSSLPWACTIKYLLAQSEKSKSLSKRISRNGAKVELYKYSSNVMLESKKNFSKIKKKWLRSHQQILKGDWFSANSKDLEDIFYSNYPVRLRQLNLTLKTGLVWVVDSSLGNFSPWTWLQSSKARLKILQDVKQR